VLHIQLVSKNYLLLNQSKSKSKSKTEWKLPFQINRIGPKLLFNGGILTTGTCAIFFGLLDKVEGHYPFIILSFLIRIIEALGNAAFLTASFAIIAKEFPDNVATTFASLETFFGLGLIVGPTVGGALFQV
jgi:MFS family permease